MFWLVVSFWFHKVPSARYDKYAVSNVSYVRFMGGSQGLCVLVGPFYYDVLVIETLNFSIKLSTVIAQYNIVGDKVSERSFV